MRLQFTSADSVRGVSTINDVRDCREDENKIDDGSEGEDCESECESPRRGKGELERGSGGVEASVSMKGQG